MHRSRLVIVTSALVTVIALLGLTSEALHGAAKKRGLEEDPVGQVPTEFGDLVAVGGSAEALALVFEDTEGALRVLELRNKLNNTVTVIDRAKSPTGRTGKLRGGVKGWKQTYAGAIPISYGSLRGIAGDTGKHAMVLRDENGTVRVVELTGSALGTSVKLIDRNYVPEKKKDRSVSTAGDR